MEELLKQVKVYQRDYAICCRSHYLASARIGRFNNWLGVPVVVVSAVIGTTIFSTLESSPELWQRITAGLLSILAAVLASLQTFLRFAERADQHKAAGARYSAIRRRLELFYLKYNGRDDSQKETAIAELAKIIGRLAELAQDCPKIPDRDFHKAEREYAKNPGEATD